MASLPVAPRFMIVSDLDHTMVDHADADNVSLLRFNALWAADYYHDSVLVFSTGRSPTLYKELRSHKPMLTPNIAIMSVGTEIMYGDSMSPDEGWQKELDKGWNREIVVAEASKFPQLRCQAVTEQRPHKVSFYVDKAQAQEVIRALTEKLQELGLRVKLIYSGGVDLDILPEGAGKGQALAYLLRKLKSEDRSPTNTLVCGDSGNDAELFSVADVYGVMVGNAQEELLHWYEGNAKGNPRIFLATERCAAGIIQAMQHFGLQPNVSPRDSSLLLVEEEHRDEYAKIGHQVVEFHLLWELWERAVVDQSDKTFQSLKHTLAPSCSLVLPWGQEVNAYDEIEALYSSYGAHKADQYQTWVDRIRIEKITDGNWLVRFDNWKRTDKEVSCRMTSSVLQSEVGTNKILWMHIHETWLKGFAGSKNT